MFLNKRRYEKWQVMFQVTNIPYEAGEYHEVQQPLGH